MKLIDNGLHSFKKAILNLKTLDDINGTERELVAKDIVLSLHHSIETLFKEMVQNKNELLIYSDLSDYFTVKMNLIKNKGKKEFSGNTITFMEAIQRAVVLNNLVMSETEYGSFERLNSVRNAITHHEYDLSGKLINYLITQVITVVFPIYKELIPNFSQYVKDNDLNLIGSIQVKEFHVWKFIRFFTLYNKFVEGKANIDKILKTTGEFKKRQEKIKKEAYITYHKCPCCEKSFFVKENLVWDNSEEKGYTGECLMCEISLDKEDSYFLYLTSADYNSFSSEFSKGYSIVRELLDDTDLKAKITLQELNDIKTIYAQTKSAELLQKFTNNYLMYKIYDTLQHYAGDIASEYDSEDLDYALFTSKMNDSRDIEELTSEDVDLLKKVIENFKALELTEEFYNEAIEHKYFYSESRLHPNPHQDNEEEEIEIELTLTLFDLSFLEE
ncbi:hypothetical protein [Cytobacillus praedii]|uniref:hypothetical protein n=1 Tax=Cytobacillus praedii TaxID=1742358 RepID=UPI002E1F73EA|nr:hypothetical protein [Cytobacillus praedii]